MMSPTNATSGKSVTISVCAHCFTFAVRMGPAELADDFGVFVELLDDGGSDASRKTGAGNPKLNGSVWAGSFLLIFVHSEATS